MTSLESLEIEGNIDALVLESELRTLRVLFHLIIKAPRFDTNLHRFPYLPRLIDVTLESNDFNLDASTFKDTPLLGLLIISGYTEPANMTVAKGFLRDISIFMLRLRRIKNVSEFWHKIDAKPSRTIVLESSLIPRLEPGIFDSNLFSYVWINQCAIGEIAPNTFSSRSSRATLKFTRSQLPHLRRNMFVSGNTFSIVDLATCKVDGLDADVWSAFDQLDEFICHDSEGLGFIAQFPPHTSSIRLDNCEAGQIRPGMFQNNKQLSSLVIREADITVIPPNFLEGLVNLMVVDLSSNRLTHIPNDFLDHTPNLDVIELNYKLFFGSST